MILLLRHVFRVVHSLVREHLKDRSTEWPRVRRDHLRFNPLCAACSSMKLVQVHHKHPFHLEPELELDPKNLISLCMSKEECHLLLGHGDNWSAYNPRVELDAAESSKYPESRGRLRRQAKLRRLFTEPQ